MTTTTKLWWFVTFSGLLAVLSLANPVSDSVNSRSSEEVAAFPAANVTSISQKLQTLPQSLSSAPSRDSDHPWRHRDPTTIERLSRKLKGQAGRQTRSGHGGKYYTNALEKAVAAAMMMQMVQKAQEAKQDALQTPPAPGASGGTDMASLLTAISLLQSPSFNRGHHS